MRAVERGEGTAQGRSNVSRVRNSRKFFFAQVGDGHWQEEVRERGRCGRRVGGMGPTRSPGRAGCSRNASYSRRRPRPGSMLTGLVPHRQACRQGRQEEGGKREGAGE